MFSYGLTIITHLAKQVYVPDRNGFPWLCQFTSHTYLTKVDSPDAVPVLIRGGKQQVISLQHTGFPLRFSCTYSEVPGKTALRTWDNWIPLTLFLYLFGYPAKRVYVPETTGFLWRCCRCHREAETTYLCQHLPGKNRFYVPDRTGFLWRYSRTYSGPETNKIYICQHEPGKTGLRTWDNWIPLTLFLDLFGYPAKRVYVPDRTGFPWRCCRSHREAATHMTMPMTLGTTSIMPPDTPDLPGSPTCC